MALDLIVRGAGSSRSPDAHLATVLSQYDQCQVISYGQIVPPKKAALIATNPTELEAALSSVRSSQVLVYGDEELLELAPGLGPDLIWISLGPDANGVREVWRIRQQHSWLSGKKLGLLIEQLADGPLPDTDRLMRLSRATNALLVPAGEAEADSAKEDAAPAMSAPESAPYQPEDEPVVDEPVVDEPVVDEPVVDEPVVEVDTQVQPESFLHTEPELITQPEPAVATDPIVEPDPDLTPMNLQGADEIVETKSIEEMTASSNNQAEQALIQRYTLVKERRSTAIRISVVEGTMQELLKDLFTLRFAAGPEAAATFEGLSRRLTESSSEFTQLSRSMASIESSLAKLAWLKEELEI